MLLFKIINTYSDRLPMVVDIYIYIYIYIYLYQTGVLKLIYKLYYILDF